MCGMSYQYNWSPLMHILVFNAGSSSLKFGVFDTNSKDSRIFKGEFNRFEKGHCTLHYRCGGEQGTSKSRQEQIDSIAIAIQSIPRILKEFGYDGFEAIGHRVAHGGPNCNHAAEIDDDLLTYIKKTTPLAPLHNPIFLEAIELSQSLWPKVPQIAVFDTAFHHTIPDYAYTYAIPLAWRELGLRRFGFHGSSHQYIALRTAQELDKPLNQLKIISCHLGSGASICAIDRGRSIDTSMGMTPLEGLVMGTRSGDVDPGMFAFLARELGLDAIEIESQLYSNSGLKGLTGSADLRDVERLSSEGDAAAQLALNVYAYRVRKYIGAYAAAMGGVDVLVFTGGVGENSAAMRYRICTQFEYLGMALDIDKNQALKLIGFEAPQIQSAHSRVQILVTQTCEQWMISQEVKALLQKEPISDKPGLQESLTTANFIGQQQRIPIAVSARHIHPSQSLVEQLFGKGYQLTKARSLTQPEGWAANETVELIGPSGSFKKVRILGPTRTRTQIEVSATDTYTLGLEAPIRDSGELDGTPIVIVRGPAGEAKTDGLIIASRHIHMSPVDAKAMRLQDGDYVDMQLGDEKRSVTFKNTLIRAKEGYVTEMHIDTDEANAAGIQTQSTGELINNEKREMVKLHSKQSSPN
jgi:acetate kinase